MVFLDTLAKVLLPFSENFNRQQPECIASFLQHLAQLKVSLHALIRIEYKFRLHRNMLNRSLKVRAAQTIQLYQG